MREYLCSLDADQCAFPLSLGLGYGRSDDCEFGAVTNGGTWKGAEISVNRLSRAEAILRSTFAAKKPYRAKSGEDH